MPQYPHSFLIDLLAMNDAASAHGCGLEPRLLEMLLDRQAHFHGTAPLNLRIRHDGPHPNNAHHEPRHMHARARPEHTTQSQN